MIKSHDVTAIEPRKLNIDRVRRRDQAAPSRYMLGCFDKPRFTISQPPNTDFPICRLISVSLISLVIDFHYAWPSSR